MVGAHAVVAVHLSVTGEVFNKYDDDKSNSIDMSEVRNAARLESTLEMDMQKDRTPGVTYLLDLEYGPENPSVFHHYSQLLLLLYTVI